MCNERRTSWPRSGSTTADRRTGRHRYCHAIQGVAPEYLQEIKGQRATAEHAGVWPAHRLAHPPIRDGMQHKCLPINAANTMHTIIRDYFCTHSGAYTHVRTHAHASAPVKDRPGWFAWCAIVCKCLQTLHACLNRIVCRGCSDGVQQRLYGVEKWRKNAHVANEE